MRLSKTVVTILTISLSSMSLIACAKKTALTADAGFIDMSSLPSTQGGIPPIRLQALRETATTLGARGALAWRAQHIDTALEDEGSYLDHVFDFNQLLLSHNVLPPILVESSNNLTLDDNNTIRMANQTYKIMAPARFVTAPPTWRTYLWMEYEKPEVPNKSLLPTNQAEAQAWNGFLKDGWKQGLIQANEIFSANVNRLQRDFLGMVLYRKMLAQNMISSPQVAKADLGVTGNQTEMRVNDAIMRITAHSALQLNSNEWNPVLTK